MPNLSKLWRWQRLWSPLLQRLGEADVNELATVESVGSVGSAA